MGIQSGIRTERLCFRITFYPKRWKTEIIDNGIRITGADSLIILSKTVKFETEFTFACAQPIADEVMAIDPDFNVLIDYNREYIGSRMKRSRLCTGDKEDFALSVEELLIRSCTDTQIDPMLMDKLYDSGRFFQITNTGKFPPMWGQHNINTNLQVCAGNSTGLFDEMDVYFRYYETKFDDFRINARKLFGARGCFAVFIVIMTRVCFTTSPKPIRIIAGRLSWMDYNRIMGLLAGYRR